MAATSTPSAEILRLAQDIRALGGAVSRRLGREFKTAAQATAATARANASWSRRIPSRIKVRVSPSKSQPGAEIVIGGLPHARLFEGLTKGGRASFRHPTFGHSDRSVHQPTRPYLRPAVKAHDKDFRAAADRAVLDAAKALGWR